MVPEEVDLAHIAIRLKPGRAQIEAARAKARMLLDSLKAGADFAALARLHSEDPGSAAQGGDLGLVRRGQFVKEFETAVFALEEGEISNFVETEFGIHLIELLERRGDAVHPRHILIRVEKSEADNDSVKAQLSSIRERALAGESFATLAKQYSEYKETALIGGNLGTTELANVDKSIYPAVADLQQGEISPPTRLTVPGFDGYQIVLMKKRVPAHEPSIDRDYARLESLAMNYKRSKDYSEWLQELRNNIYWRSQL
jgi:peptidyl-prolyl cis-trans isomerase SurA